MPETLNSCSKSSWHIVTPGRTKDSEILLKVLSALYVHENPYCKLPIVLVALLRRWRINTWRVYVELSETLLVNKVGAVLELAACSAA